MDRQSLDERQQVFLIKRRFFHAVGIYTAWTLGIFAVVAWGVLYLFKPVLVNPAHILQLMRDKQIDFLSMSEIAVTGAAAVSALFFILVVLSWVLNQSSRREKNYLEIIEQLQKEKK